MKEILSMQKIILDVDTGIDDALALLYAIAEEELDIVGVTTTYGNIDVDQATKNSLSILDSAGAVDVPVYQGSSHSLSSEEYIRREITTKIHGEDGIGNANFKSSTRISEEQHAVDFLIEAALKHGKELKLICVGPLTNLARAYKKNSEAIKNVGEIVIMGGALTVPGNVTDFAEANIIEDTIAAKTILESDLPLKLVGLDVTMRTILTEKETDEWEKYSTELSRNVVKMTQHYFKTYRDRLGMLGCALHDPLAVGIALYPELAEILAIDLTVSLEEPARGMTIGHYGKLNNPEPTTEVCIQIDHEKFLTLFMRAMEKVLV